MDTRLEQLTLWLKSELRSQHFELSVASADASFRRYFRIKLSGSSLIAMDAPPDKENSEPFVRISMMLSRLAVHSPKIYAQNLDLGFILLEDLGSTDYLDVLGDTKRADQLYSDAIDALIKIQSGADSSETINRSNQVNIDDYSKTKLEQEMELFNEWFLERHLSQKMTSEQEVTWRNTKHFLCRICAEQPQVWVHRDFHSRNLMVTSDNNPGVIDFQDLVRGPISYDLASIFKDCYIEWPRAQQLEWLELYHQRLSNPSFSLDQLVKWYDLTGLQRHLKVLGIFCRLNYRDSKPGYLDDLPLVAKYVVEVLDLYADSYDELQAFKGHLSSTIRTAL